MLVYKHRVDRLLHTHTHTHTHTHARTRTLVWTVQGILGWVGAVFSTLHERRKALNADFSPDRLNLHS